MKQRRGAVSWHHGQGEEQDRDDLGMDPRIGLDFTEPNHHVLKQEGGPKGVLSILVLGLWAPRPRSCQPTGGWSPRRKSPC